MYRLATRFGGGVALLAALLSQAPAQDPTEDQPAPAKAKGKDKQPPPRTDFGEFFKPPETVAEYWEAIRYEIGVGKYDLAADYLHGLIARKPRGEDLAPLEDEQGLRAFVRLRNIRKWSDDPKVDRQAKRDADELLAILARYHTDPARIGKFIKNLTGEPEERTYAIRELQRAGPAAVPPLVEAIRPAEGSEREALVSVLPQLPREAGPPLYAALDIPDNGLKLDLIDAFMKRVDAESIPSLWYPSAATSLPETVRGRATQALSLLMRVDVAKLPPATFALTREAERYYYHQARLPDVVTVWRWDGKALVAGWPGAPTVSTSQAEQYFGLKYARAALDLDPAYPPAQVVFLSLAIDKEPDSSAVSRLLATVNPDLVISVLDRALTDHRLAVLVGSVRALGDLAEVRAAQPRSQGESPLVRALYYPERRVQLAAAEALVRIPSPNGPPSIARVVDVLRRAAAAEPDARPKVVVASFNEGLRQEMANTATKAGFQAIKFATGREVMRRLGEAADIDSVLLDANLPDPGLAGLLGQLRADANVGQLPVVLAAPLDRLDALRRSVESVRNVSVIPLPNALDPETLRRVLIDPDPTHAAQPLNDAEKKDQQERALRSLARLLRQGVAVAVVEPAAEAIENGLQAKVSNETLSDVIEATGRLSGARPQRELAGFVADAARPTPLRLAATSELVRHIQANGVLLTQPEVSRLEGLFTSSGTDAALRARVALVLGSLRPNPALTGERLRNYAPPQPGAAPARTGAPNKT